MEQWREDVLIHYGVKGMKWGVRRYDQLSKKYADRGNLSKSAYYSRKRDIKSGHMKIDKTDLRVTRQTKKDWNNLSKKEFAKKYKATKGSYARRVAKDGDPFKKSAEKLNFNKAGIKRFSELAERELQLLNDKTMDNDARVKGLNQFYEDLDDLYKNAKYQKG